jgi:hypothetical protein
VEAICASLDGSNGAVVVLERVASLIDKSLLQQTEREGEEPRLVMLETIREYGLAALAMTICERPCSGRWSKQERRRPGSATSWLCDWRQR